MQTANAILHFAEATETVMAVELALVKMDTLVPLATFHQLALLLHLLHLHHLQPQALFHLDHLEPQILVLQVPLQAL